MTGISNSACKSSSAAAVAVLQAMTNNFIFLVCKKLANCWLKFLPHLKDESHDFFGITNEVKLFIWQYFHYF